MQCHRVTRQILGFTVKFCGLIKGLRIEPIANVPNLTTVAALAQMVRLESERIPQRANCTCCAGVTCGARCSCHAETRQRISWSVEKPTVANELMLRIMVRHLEPAKGPTLEAYMFAHICISCEFRNSLLDCARGLRVKHSTFAKRGVCVHHHRGSLA